MSQPSTRRPSNILDSPTRPSNPTFDNPLSVPLSSPSKEIDQKHHAQLASYKRDPAKGSSKRSVKVSRAWTGIGRRISTVKEVDEDGIEKPRRRIPIRKSRIIRWALIALSSLVIYYFIIKPLFPTKKPLPPPPPVSTRKPRATLAPLHHRRKAHNVSSSTNGLAGRRAPLPPLALFKSAPPHEVENGLLKVRADSPIHPIYQLIRDARDEWDSKVERQSRTLEDAVAEYKRRYRMAPPKGFDKWWAYVCEHDIPLPDEYDQIQKDIRPFHALSPKDLNERITKASRYSDTYTLKVRQGSVRTSTSFAGIDGAEMRLNGQLELLKPVAKWIGDMTVVYSIHDTPTALLGWEHRQDLLEHVEDGEYIDVFDRIDLSQRGWAAACPHNSAMRKHKSHLTPPPVPNTALNLKTFIFDHAATMSICDHPSSVPLHGVLSGKNPVIETLTPIFSLSKTTLHGDILGVPTEQFPDFNAVRHIPFDKKTQDKALWRGSNTGAHFSSETTWRASHRARLIRLGDMPVGPVISLLPPPRGMRGGTLEEMTKELQWNEVNKVYTDMAFTGYPIQCDVSDGTCQDLLNEFQFVDGMTHDEALQYKYIIDVDGNAWSARFKRLLTTGSLIFKSTIMPEWWTDRIQPWVHYVPFQVDYSDLYDVVSFFRGDLNGKNGETALAQEIAQAGREYSRTHWRKEDMTAYVFRLYLEWARLVAPSRAGMDFVYKVEMEIKRTGL